MAEEKEPLSVAEQSIISKALVNLINSYGELPEEVYASWQYISDNDRLAVCSMQGAVKTEEYLCMPGEESFDGQFPFFILYRVIPDDISDRINGQDFLDTLAEWLEKAELPKLTGGRTITEIKRTSTSFLAERMENGMEDYQCNFNLIYEKR